MDERLAELTEKFPNYTFSQNGYKINVSINGICLGIAGPNMSEDIHNNIIRLMQHCTKISKSARFITCYIGLITIILDPCEFTIGRSISSTLGSYLDKYELVLESSRKISLMYPNYKLLIGLDLGFVFQYRNHVDRLVDLSDHVHNTIVITTEFLDMNSISQCWQDESNAMTYYFETYSVVVCLSYYKIYRSYEDGFLATSDDVFDFVKTHSPHLFENINKPAICDGTL